MTYTYYQAPPALSEGAPERIEPPRQRIDLPLPQATNTALLVVWICLCLLGLALARWTGMVVLGGLVVAVPTFFGMVIKPSFGLCIAMLVLPTGAFALAGTDPYATTTTGFTLDRAVGTALAVSFALNLILVSRLRLTIRGPALWLIVAMTFWIAITPLWSEDYRVDIQGTKTHGQLLILMLIVYWILHNSEKSAYIWALRSYVVGCVVMNGYTLVTGKVGAMEQAGKRVSATIAGDWDPNAWSAVIVLGFLSAAYLMAKDKKALWRCLYGVALILLPIMVLRAASRTAIVSLAAALTLPTISPRQLVRKPSYAVLMILLMVIAVGAGAYFLRTAGLSRGVEERLISQRKVSKAASGRLHAWSLATEVAMKWPLGGGKSSWLIRSGIPHIPHADIFFVLGLYGVVGASLYLAVLVAVAIRVWRLPVGLEGLFGKAVFIFLGMFGLGIAQISMKSYWVYMIVILQLPLIAGTLESQPWLRHEAQGDSVEYGYY